MCEKLELDKANSRRFFEAMGADSDIKSGAKVISEGIMNSTTSFHVVEMTRDGKSESRSMFESTVVSKFSVIHENKPYVEVEKSSSVIACRNEFVSGDIAVLSSELEKSSHISHSVSFTSLTAAPSCSPAWAPASEETSTSGNTHGEDVIPGTFIPVLRSGCYEDMGPRNYMEDVHLTIDDISSLIFQGTFQTDGPQAFYGVFDGHGGAGAAHFAKEHILRNIVEHPAFPDHMAAAFRGAFERTDMQLEAAWRENMDEGSGTTALTVFVSGRTLIVGNVGDCRAVLSRRGKAVELTKDQKPCAPSEKARIEAAGGTVDKEYYLNGLLGVARALGNWHLQELKAVDSNRRIAGPLISEPEVYESTLTEDDEFFILACDGLWDVISSQTAVSFARERLQEHNDPQRCSKELVEKALERTSDNLTVVTVCLQADPPPKLQRRPWRPGFKRSISDNALSSIQKHLNMC